MEKTVSIIKEVIVNDTINAYSRRFFDIFFTSKSTRYHFILSSLWNFLCKSDIVRCAIIKLIYVFYETHTTKDSYILAKTLNDILEIGVNDISQLDAITKFDNSVCSYHITYIAQQLKITYGFEYDTTKIKIENGNDERKILLVLKDSKNHKKLTIILAIVKLLQYANVINKFDIIMHEISTMISKCIQHPLITNTDNINVFKIMFFANCFMRNYLDESKLTNSDIRDLKTGQFFDVLKDTIDKCNAMFNPKSKRGVIKKCGKLTDETYASDVVMTIEDEHHEPKANILNGQTGLLEITKHSFDKIVEEYEHRKRRHMIPGGHIPETVKSLLHKIIDKECYNEPFTPAENVKAKYTDIKKFSHKYFDEFDDIERHLSGLIEQYTLNYYKNINKYLLDNIFGTIHKNNELETAIRNITGLIHHMSNTYNSKLLPDNMILSISRGENFIMIGNMLNYENIQRGNRLIFPTFYSFSTKNPYDTISISTGDEKEIMLRLELSNADKFLMILHKSHNVQEREILLPYGCTIEIIDKKHYTYVDINGVEKRKILVEAKPISYFDPTKKLSEFAHHFKNQMMNNYSQFNERFRPFLDPTIELPKNFEPKTRTDPSCESLVHK